MRMLPSIRSLSSFAAAAAILCLVSHAALAAPTPISPITATASSNFMRRGIEFTVGGFDFTSGLSAGSGPVDPDTGLVFPQHMGEPEPFSMWHTTGDPGTVPATATFDLGAAYNVDRVWIYNYSEINPGRTSVGTANIGEITTSLDGVTFTPLLSDITLTRAPEQTDDYDTPDVISLERVNAQFVRFVDLNPFSGGFVGLSEVIFFEERIPEPSTLLLAILGLLGLASSGLRRRRRR